MKKIFFFIGLLLAYGKTYSQVLPDSMAVEVSSIVNAESIKERTLLFFDSVLERPFTPIEDVPAQKFVPLQSYTRIHSIPGHLVIYPIYVAFKLKNSSDSTVSLYYYPGSLYSNLNLYQKVTSGNLQPLYFPGKSTGYIHLSILPDQTITYVVQLEFCKTIFNNITSELVTKKFLPYFKMEVDKPLNNKKIIGFILSGILVMMILFTLVNFFITRRREFIYNCLYTLLMFLLIFFTPYLSNDADWFKVFFIGYLDLFLLIIGTVFYLAFTRKFLNTKVIFPWLDKFLWAEQLVLLILMAVFSLLYFFTDNFTWQNRIENTLKVFALAAAVIYIAVALLKKNKLMNYLAVGTAAQIFLSIISFILILTGISTEFIFTSPVFYFEMGVIISVIFFLLGLTYKNRQELIDKIQEQEAMKLEVEKKGFENKLAIINAQQAERNRISADMHDDLGAGMTSIRLYSELAKAKIGSPMIPEIEKISSSASELIDKMNAIIWSMSSSNDSFGNMIAYIRSYVQEYFEDFPAIKCSISLPEHLPNIEVNGEVRRNIFLVIKEALHNIVKHADATEVVIVMDYNTEGLTLTIQDNGKGIDMNNVRTFGNGLKNMKKRMDDIGVDFSIKNHNGTLIKLYRLFA
ncbi:MAG: 7TM diverse intracellular signaling domain-containing protein [Ferruginibacter sp.]